VTGVEHGLMNVVGDEGLFPAAPTAVGENRATLFRGEDGKASGPKCWDVHLEE